MSAWRRVFRSRAVLWAAFVVVHAVVAALGWLLPNQPMGDVYLVYEPWSDRAVAGDRIVGVTESWVYPALALMPMMLAQLFGFAGPYAVGWALLVTLCDAAAFAVLLGRGRSSGRIAAAWFWLAFALLLGPVGMYRIDAITVPIAVLGVLWVAGRPAVSGALLAAGAWIKVWPAAALAAAFVALFRRRRRAAVALATGAVVASAVVCAAVMLAGGGGHLLGFVTAQTGRGLQIEAPAAAPYLWGAASGAEGWGLAYDGDILTFQVFGPGVDPLAALLTPLLAAASLAILALAAVKATRGASLVRLLPPLMLAMAVAFIVCNKVGSPQFQTWLIAPLVLWLLWDRRRALPVAVLAMAIAALTQLVYPIAYWSLLAAEPLGVALVTLRNLGLVALGVWLVIRLARVPTRSRAATRSGMVR